VHNGLNIKLAAKNAILDSSITQMLKWASRESPVFEGHHVNFVSMTERLEPIVQ
jgi:hypothetical protein